GAGRGEDGRGGQAARHPARRLPGRGRVPDRLRLCGRPPATASPTACGSAADRPRPGSIIACEIPRGAPTAPGEALAAQSRYGYRRTQAGMHVVPHAMAATAAYYAVQEARGYPVQGAGA